MESLKKWVASPWQLLRKLYGILKELDGIIEKINDTNTKIDVFTKKVTNQFEKFKKQVEIRLDLSKKARDVGAKVAVIASPHPVQLVKLLEDFNQEKHTSPKRANPKVTWAGNKII